MKKLSKNLQKRISKGDHGALMDGIEELFDMYHTEPWTEGFNACMDDVSVHSYRLAEHIIESPIKKMDVIDLAKLIEEYFENALKA